MDQSMMNVDWDAWDGTCSKSDEDLYEPWAAPSEEEMVNRTAYRQSMQDQTEHHRRTTQHQNDERSILSILKNREIYGAKYTAKRRRMPTTVEHEIRLYGEYYSMTRYHSAFLKHLGGEDEVDENGARPASSEAISTISIAFSSDSQTMASTHGDHTVKITCCSTGRLLETLEGHPRTPWTVKYHPLQNNILASGCLGFQVRVWDWHSRTCLRMIRLDYAIISLSFHPEGHILAVASGSRLHFWDFDNYGGRKDSNGATASGTITAVEQRNMLRCVHFPPDGKSVIVGGMNPNQDHPRRTARARGGMSGGGISFYLRLWDFDAEAALHSPAMDDPRLPHGTTRQQRKPLANPQLVVPRALLYNDGGFDVSPDGKTLCACAEYWLPDGVNSAMELLDRERDDFSDVESDDELNPDGSNDVVMSPQAMATNQPPYLSPPRQRVFRFTINPPPPPSTPTTLPVTPPNISRGNLLLSPPSPPGRRWAGGLRRNDPRGNPSNAPIQAVTASNVDRPAYHLNEAPCQSPQASIAASARDLPLRPPHPLSVITTRTTYSDMTRKPGRYVPHVATVSLETTPLPQHCGIPPQLRNIMTSVAKGYRPRLGQLLEACPLDGTKASAVTCVKFAPSADFCLLGYGVREPISTEGEPSQFHPVTALYRVRGGMTHVSTMLSGDDDVNIARFHPDSGYGFVYGTKQGRVRVLSPRPCTYYYYNK